MPHPKQILIDKDKKHRSYLPNIVVLSTSSSSRSHFLLSHAVSYFVHLHSFSVSALDWNVTMLLGKVAHMEIQNHLDLKQELWMQIGQPESLILFWNSYCFSNYSEGVRTVLYCIVFCCIVFHCTVLLPCEDSSVYESRISIIESSAKAVGLTNS